MNTALGLLATAWLAGAEPVIVSPPAAMPAGTPVYMSGSQPAHAVAGEVYTEYRPGLLARLKSCFHRGGDYPANGTVIYEGPHMNGAAGENVCGGPGLLQRIFGLAHKSDCGCTQMPAGSTYAPHGMVQGMPPTAPPPAMPQVEQLGPPKVQPKKAADGPAVGNSLPVIQTTPVSRPKGNIVIETEKPF